MCISRRYTVHFLSDVIASAQLTTDLIFVKNTTEKFTNQRFVQSKAGVECKNINTNNNFCFIMILQTLGVDYLEILRKTDNINIHSMIKTNTYYRWYVTLQFRRAQYDKNL